MNLLILGAGGLGSVAKETAEAIGIYKKVSFLDDYSSEAIGKLMDYRNFVEGYSHAFIAISNNEQREKLYLELEVVGYQIAELIHPMAYVSPTAKIEPGVIILPRATINTNAIVHRGAIIGIGSLVDHDATIGEFCFIKTGAIIESGCIVHSNTKVETGEIYNGKQRYQGFEVEYNRLL